MSEPTPQEKEVFIQVLAQVAAGTLQRLQQEGKGDCIRTVVGNAMYGVKLHEKGGIQIFREGAFLLQEGKQPKPFIIECGDCSAKACKVVNTKGRAEGAYKLDSAIDTLIS